MDYYSFFSGIDENLLLFFNGYHTPALDRLMWAVSDRWIWLPLYALLTLTLIRRSGIRKGLFILLFVAAMITATDQTCASFIRPLVCRLRPSNPDNPLSQSVTLVNGYHAGRYGFPSCHAANTFALAMFLSLLFRNRYITCTLIAWSLLVSYSRLYLGVHYPGDILGGFAVGGACALVYYLPVYWYEKNPLAGPRRLARGSIS